MTTPQAPGAPEGGQTVEPTAPGAQDPAPQQGPNNQPLGKPDKGQQAPGAPADKPDPEPADDPQDVKSLPDWAQKALKKARSDAGNARTTAKQQAAEEARTQLMAEISKTLGLNTDGEPTVEDLAKQLEERQTRIDELEAAQTEHAYEKVVRSAATTANADADALLDSTSFLADVQDELPDEFTDADMAKAVAKVAKEYAKRPRFAKTAAPARSGGEMPAGPPAPTKQRPKSLTEALNGQYGVG
jgi:hypothetical protein